MKKIFTFLALILTFTTTAQDIIPDNTFGTDGFFTIEEFNDGTGNTTSTIQADGKIILLDQRTTSERVDELFIARLNADGTPDLSFADNGFFTDVQFEDFTLNPDVYRLFLLQGDIIALTTSGIIRLNSNGELVTTFGDNGVLSDAPAVRNSTLIGNILYSTSFGSSNNVDFNFLDTLNLDTEETSSTPLNFLNEGFTVSLLQGANGLLYLERINDQTNETTITAIDINGSLNTTFGDNGTILLHQFRDLDEFEQSFISIKVDTAGNLYASVLVNGFTTLVQKFDTNGNLVTGFGNAGTTSIPNTLITTLNVSGNLLYLAGAEITTDADDELIIELSVVRLNTETGELDTTFNNTGIFVFDSNTLEEFASDIHILSADSFIVSGNSTSPNRNQFIARFIDSKLLSTNNTALPTNSIRFKNPITTHILTFSSTSNIDNISLYNVLGRKVAFIKNAKEINTSTLSNGTYFARLTLKDKQIITKKVIINR